MGFLGKPVKELVHIDLGAKLEEKGLQKLFPVEVCNCVMPRGPVWACMGGYVRHGRR